jgi:thiamine-phosphate pyrophosphorylase
MKAGGVRLPGGRPVRPSEHGRRVELLRSSLVYLVTEEAFSAGRSSVDIATAALAAGVRVIQVREKEGTARRALEVAQALRESTRQFDALLLIDDRIDIALAVDADGVHLGQQDVPVSVARRLLGQDALIGLSITEETQLDRPDASEADYLGVGAVFPTETKGDADLTGLNLVRLARGRARGAPVVAIGGITPENAAEVIRAGADSLAVITAITRAADPGQAAAELLRVAWEAMVNPDRATIVNTR